MKIHIAPSPIVGVRERLSERIKSDPYLHFLLNEGDPNICWDVVDRNGELSYLAGGLYNVLSIDEICFIHRLYREGLITVSCQIENTDFTQAEVYRVSHSSKHLKSFEVALIKKPLPNPS